MRVEATVKSLFASITNNLQIYRTTLHTHKSLSKKKLENFLVSPKNFKYFVGNCCIFDFVIFFRWIFYTCTLWCRCAVSCGTYLGIPTQQRRPPTWSLPFSHMCWILPSLSSSAMQQTEWILSSCNVQRKSLPKKVLLDESYILCTRYSTMI